MIWASLVPGLSLLKLANSHMSEHSSQGDRGSGVSRRAFLQGSGAAAAASTVVSQTVAQDTATGSRVVSGETSIRFSLNGKQVTAKVEPRTTLLDMLRYQFDVTSAKPVSSDGSSGASTVLVDGKPVTASTVLAMTVSGKSITTCEHLDDAVARAFVANDAQQCGFCTPGFVVAVRAFVNQHPDATEAQIRAGLNGNICRCGTYSGVLDAVLSLVKGDQNG